MDSDKQIDFLDTNKLHCAKFLLPLSITKSKKEIRQLESIKYNHINKFVNELGFGVLKRFKLVFALFLLIGLIGISAQEAKASHLRGVSISWAPTGNPGEVEFRFLESERRFDNQALGSIQSRRINFGDETSGFAVGPVSSVNADEDYFVAELSVRHTYAGAGPYIAFYQSGARISTLRNGKANKSGWRRLLRL